MPSLNSPHGMGRGELAPHTDLSRREGEGVSLASLIHTLAPTNPPAQSWEG